MLLKGACIFVMMRERWPIILSLLCMMVIGRPDLSAQDKSAPRYRLSTIPTQVLFLEFPLIVERRCDRSTWGLIGSYRPAFVRSGEIPGRGPYHLQNNWNFAHEQITAGLLHKFYLRDRYGFHLETQLLYRHWWFDAKNITYEDDDDVIVLRSTKQDVVILKLLIGKSVMWHRKKGPAHVMDLYAGASIRSKTIRSTLRSVGGHASEFEEEDRIWLPGLQIGLRYGIGWGK